jgi:hypothetical protein
LQGRSQITSWQPVRVLKKYAIIGLVSVVDETISTRNSFLCQAIAEEYSTIIDLTDSASEKVLPFSVLNRSFADA